MGEVVGPCPVAAEHADGEPPRVIDHDHRGVAPLVAGERASQADEVATGITATIASNRPRAMGRASGAGR